jgi:glutamate-1-semialdehyde 2,1-aminomutase
MAAGLATLQLIEDPQFFDSLNAQTRKLADGLAAEALAANVPLAVEACGGMFGFIFCSDGPVRKFAQVAAADIDRFRKFFHGMLEQGIYLAPSAFEAGFVSAAHGDDEISCTLEAAQKVFRTL